MCGHSTGAIAMIVSYKLASGGQKFKMADGGFENSFVQISAFTHDSNEIPTATPMFPGSGNTGNTVPCLGMSLIKDGGH